MGKILELQACLQTGLYHVDTYTVAQLRPAEASLNLYKQY